MPHLTCPLGGFGWINTQQGNYKVKIQKTAKNQDNAFKSNCIKIMWMWAFVRVLGISHVLFSNYVTHGKLVCAIEL